MLKVSKTGFMNLVRCRRFAGLQTLYKDKLDAIVSFSDDETDIMNAENEGKKRLYLDEMFEDEEDILAPEAIELTVLQPYYNKIETLSAQAISNQFEGTLTFAANTFQQKKFDMMYKGYQFYCYLDGYLDGEVNRVFESKATTSNKFFKMAYQGESIFKTNIDGIVMLKRELGYHVDGMESKEKAFYDKYNEVGVYVYDLAYQRFVIEHSKAYEADKPYKYYLAVLNHEYVYDGAVDENNEPIYSDDIIRFIDLTDVTAHYMPIIEEEMDNVVSYLDQMHAGEVDLGKHCQRKKTRECLFYPVCFNKLPEKNSILTYMANHHGFVDERGYKHLPYDLINQDKRYRLLDIPEVWLTRENNVIQRRVVENNETYIDKGKIKAGIDQLRYPIYHLDFESFPCPLPRYKNEKPYQQSLFQFSIHIEHEHQTVDEDRDNIAYLAPDLTDRREDLIKALIDAIKPDGGSVLVYNQSFESSRIKELADMFPQYKDRLHDISNRLFDLMHIVKTNNKFYQSLGYDEPTAKRVNYYASNLNGSYSIKKVLPSLTDLSYDNLPIRDGVNAYVTYAKYNVKDTLNHEKAMDGLIRYCRRDTYSMYLILDKLREIIKN